MEDKYITVSQLSRYLKFKFDQDPNLGQVFLKGEISNFKAHTRGHYYFTIKDEGSRINAVMFSSQVNKLNFMPEDGMKIMVIGRVSVYETTGGYQIYVDSMMPDGVGNLYIEFEKLKKKLASEGLFDPAKKKKIPKFPETVGIVTAPTGAAIRDILSTIKRRWPSTKTILFPSLVQGASAAPDIVANIKKAQEFDLDVLIVGRGGGSIEDMWCFNDEEVARAIYNCKIPIISAVGHEIDFTIADFVADLRAPTPTGAAEMAVANKDDFYNYLNQVNLRLNKAMNTYINENRERLNRLKNHYILKNPISIYEIKEQRFDTTFEKLQYVMTSILTAKREQLNYYENHYIIKNPTFIYFDKRQIFDGLFEKIPLLMTSILASERNRYEKYIEKVSLLTERQLDKSKNSYINLLNKLEVLNPLLTIKRGYSITKKDDKVIASVKNVKIDDDLVVELTDGVISTKVVDIKESQV